MTTPVRWIERAEDVLILPPNPAEWTAEQRDQLAARLNCDGLRRAVAAALRQAAEKAEREGNQEGIA